MEQHKFSSCTKEISLLAAVLLVEKNDLAKVKLMQLVVKVAGAST